MKNLTILLIPLMIFLTGCTTKSTTVSDTPENRLKAAKEYLRATPLKLMLDDIAKEIAKSLPENQRIQFIELISKEFRVDVLERAALIAMTKHYTVNELNALAKFYSSPEGKSIQKKIGKYTAEIMPPIRNEVMRALKALQRSNNYYRS